MKTKFPNNYFRSKCLKNSGLKASESFKIEVLIVSLILKSGVKYLQMLSHLISYLSKIKILGLRQSKLRNKLICSNLTISLIYLLFLVFQESLAYTNRVEIFPTTESFTQHKYRLVWPTIGGSRYEVEETTNLIDWYTGYAVVATGPVQQMIFKAGNVSRFYRVKTFDEQAPMIKKRYPADGAFSVKRFSDIEIEIDDASGIDTNSITLVISTLGRYTLANKNLMYKAGVLKWLNDGSTSIGGWGSNVTVTVILADVFGNSTTNEWQFTLEREPKTVTNLFVFGSPQALMCGQRIEKAPTSALLYGYGVKPMVTSSSSWVIKSVNSNSVIISYSESAPDITKGTYICNLTPVTADEIFYRRVTGVRNDMSGRVMTLYTENVPLEKFIESGSVSISSDSMLYELDTNNVIIKAISSSFSFGNIGLDLSGIKLYEYSGISISFDEAKWFYRPNVKLALDFYWYSLQRIYFGVDGPMNTVVVPRLTFSYEKTDDRSFDLFSKRHVIFVGSIGPVPIWLDFKFLLKAEVGYSVGGAISAAIGFTQQTDLGFYMEYDKNSSPNLACGPTIKIYPLEMVPFSYDIGAGFSAYAKLVPQLDFLVNSVAGLYVNIDPGLELNGRAEIVDGQFKSNIGLIANADLNIGLSVVGVDQEKLPSLAPINIFRKEWMLQYPSESSLKIKVQPRSVVARVNDSVCFSVDAESKEQISYQWYYNEIPIPGMTHRDFIIDPVKETDVGVYHVVLKSGKETIRSSNAVLTVYSGNGPIKVSRPIIVPGVENTIILSNKYSWAEYELFLERGDIYNISITNIQGRDFKPLIILNSPVGESLNSSISNMIGYVSDTGTYKLLALDLAGEHAGSFGLVPVIFHSYQVPLGDSPLTNDISTIGFINVHSFNTSSNALFFAVVLPCQQSKLFNPKMKLFTADGGFVYESEKSDWLFGAECIPWISSKNGTYYLLVYEDGFDSVGKYIISLAKPFDGDSSTYRAKEIKSGEVVRSAINNAGEFNFYTFEIKEEHEPCIMVALNTNKSVNFMPKMLLTYSNEVSAVSGNYAEGFSTIEFADLKSGRYTLTLFDYGMNDIGEYIITMVRPLGFDVSDEDSGEIDNGAIKMGMIEQPGDMDRFTVYLSESDWYYVVVSPYQTNKLWPKVRLYGPGGELRGYGYGSESFKVAEIYGRTEKPGLYSLIISDIEYTSTGNYLVSFIKSSGLINADLDSKNAAINEIITGKIEPAIDIDRYKISLTAGSNYWFCVSPKNDSKISPVMSFHVPDGSLAWQTNIIGSITNIYPLSGFNNFSYTAPLSGEYTVFIYDSTRTKIGEYTFVCEQR